MRFNLVFLFPGATRGWKGVKQEFQVPISCKLGTQYSELATGKKDNGFFAEQASTSNKSCSIRLNFNR